MGSRLIEMSGQRFGMLTVLRIGDTKRENSGCIYWRVRCDCGTEKDVAGTNLRNGKTRSCGDCVRSRGRLGTGLPDASPHARKPAPTWSGCADAIADLAACLGMR